MAKPTISLMGATYSDVSGVELPISGGGTASFPFVEGSDTVTQNGTYDVTALASLIVNVSGGGGSGLDYESGTYQPEAEDTRPTISFAKTHSKPPAIIVLSDTDESLSVATSSPLMFVFADLLQLNGAGIPRSSSGLGYSFYGYWRKTGTTSYGFSGYMTMYSYQNTGDASNNYSRYFATETYFRPYSGGGNYKFHVGSTYKWIAVWK